MSKGMTTDRLVSAVSWGTPLLNMMVRVNAGVSTMVTVAVMEPLK